MAEYVFPEGGPQDPAIFIAINGRDFSVTAGVPFEPSAAVLEVLNHSHFRDDLQPAPVEEGGGGALVSIDFKNGAYALEGVSKTVGEVVEQNGDFDDFDVGSIVPGVGLKAEVTTGDFAAASVGPALTAAARDLVLISNGGCTAVMTYSLVGDVSGGGGVSIAVSQGDYTGYSAEGGFLHTVADGATMWDYGGSTAAMTLDGGTAHKAAFTMAPDRLSGSADGNAVVSIPLDAATATLVGMALQVSNDAAALTKTVILEKIEFFEVVDDTALPGLSA